MRYGVTTEATDFSAARMNDWRVKVVKALLFFIPRANPDNEPDYPKVKSWALELSDEGIPQREIGLSESGVVLFAAPDERNTGFWPDMASKRFKTEELKPLSAEEFQSLWLSASRQRSQTRA